MSLRGKQKKFQYRFKDEVKKTILEHGIELPDDVAFDLSFEQENEVQNIGIKVMTRSKSGAIDDEKLEEINKVLSPELARIMDMVLTEFNYRKGHH